MQLCLHRNEVTSIVSLLMVIDHMYALKCKGLLNVIKVAIQEEKGHAEVTVDTVNTVLFRVINMS